MRKILFLALHLGYGGTEKAIISEANMLADKYNVEIACAYKLHDKPAFSLDKRVKVAYLSEHMKPNKEELKNAIRNGDVLEIIREGWKSLQVLHYRKARMKQVIRNSDADLIISTRYLYHRLLGNNKPKGAVTIAQEHNHHNNNEKYIKKMIRSVCEIDYFMPVSEELTRFYADRQENTKCIYIPHSLEYIPEETSKLNKPILISIGRLSKEKGYPDLIQMFSELTDEYPQWELHIVGDGEEHTALEDAIRQYKLETKVILHGFQNKKFINELLSQSSIYVMTSFEESFGIVLIEAQSFGIPCVAYDSARGALEIIKHGVNGYLIADRNMQEMCACVKTLMDNSELRQELGKKGRENSLQYSATRIKKMWYEFIENI